MGKKKSREYSSDSNASSSDSEKIEKKKKHKKSSKKSKKHKSKKKRRNDSSSENSEQDSWIEHNVDKKKSPEAPPKHNREDWMTADNFFIPTFSKEKQISKSAAEKTKHEIYDPVSSMRELNPYFKTGEGGMPSFQIPKDSDNDYANRPSSSKPSSGKGNWRKSKDEENFSREKDRTRSRSPARTSQKYKENKTEENSRSRSSSPVPVSSEKPEFSALHSDFLTDQQMNEIGAKQIKAELRGNTTLAEKLKEKLDRAKAFKNSGKVPPQIGKREEVILSITNTAGTSRPISQREDEPRGRPQDKKKKNKRVETHINGERSQYYADDGKYDIKQMFEAERLNVDNKDQDIEFAKAISKVKNSDQMDMADIFSDNIRKDKQNKHNERDEAIREHQRMEKILDSCNKCFDSPKMQKELLVHVGKKIYLAIPYYEGLVNHHLVISPIQHIPAVTMIEEDHYEEFLTLKTLLQNFFLSRNEDVVFFETVRYLNRRPHCEVHCVSSSQLEMVQFYFKKGIQESEKGTLNKKLIEIKADKNMRRSVPRGLPYFWVDFGSTGMAHVIEDQESFPPNFAEEIIGGMLNLNVNKWRKPRKESQPKKRVDYFSSLLKNVLKNLSN